MVDRSLVERNAAALARVESLVARLTDEDLARPLDAGWTVSAALAHLAFWEQRALVLLQKWERAGVGHSPVDVDVINDALLPQWRALPPRAVTRQLVETMRAVAQKLASAGPDTLAAIDAAGQPMSLDRSEHAGEHLDEIERALSARTA